MRSIFIITLLLFLLNITKQEKTFYKIRRGNEIQKLQARLPVKNYISVQDNENRKVNKYKEDLSQESEETSEEKSQKHVFKKKKEEIISLRNYEDKKERQKAYEESLEKWEFKTKVNVEDSEDESSQKPRKNKKYLNKEAPSPKKYFKQANEKSLTVEDEDYGKAGRMRQKSTYGSYEEKGISNKFKLKKNLVEDDESFRDNENDQDEKSYETEETDDGDDLLDKDDSLQCASIEDGTCDI